MAQSSLPTKPRSRIPLLRFGQQRRWAIQSSYQLWLILTIPSKIAKSITYRLSSSRRTVRQPNMAGTNGVRPSRYVSFGIRRLGSWRNRPFLLVVYKARKEWFTSTLPRHMTMYLLQLNFQRGIIARKLVYSVSSLETRRPRQVSGGGNRCCKLTPSTT